MAGEPDDYERRFMDADRAVLRVRQRQPRWMVLLLLGQIAVTALAVLPALSELWLHRGVGPMTGMLVAVVATFAVSTMLMALGALLNHLTRVVVTPTHLRVHRGVLTQDLALETITGVGFDALPWWHARGLTRRRLTGRDMVIVHAGSRGALRVDWRDDRGRDRTTWFQFDAAEEVCVALEKVLAQRSGVRVDATDDMAPARASDDEAARNDAAVARARRGE